MLTGHARWKEIMASPMTRAEARSLEERLSTYIASVASAIEAMETLLIEKGVLKENELMDAITRLVKQKQDAVSGESEAN